MLPATSRVAMLIVSRSDRARSGRASRLAGELDGHRARAGRKRPSGLRDGHAAPAQAEPPRGGPVHARAHGQAAALIGRQAQAQPGAANGAQGLPRCPDADAARAACRAAAARASRSAPSSARRSAAWSASPSESAWPSDTGRCSRRSPCSRHTAAPARTRRSEREAAGEGKDDQERRPADDDANPCLSRAWCPPDATDPSAVKLHVPVRRVYGREGDDAGGRIGPCAPRARSPPLATATAHASIPTPPPPEHRADPTLTTYVQRVGPFTIGSYGMFEDAVDGHPAGGAGRDRRRWTRGWSTRAAR